jgi:hypothetical protein
VHVLFFAPFSFHSLVFICVQCQVLAQVRSALPPGLGRTPPPARKRGGRTLPASGRHLAPPPDGGGGGADSGGDEGEETRQSIEDEIEESAGKFVAMSWFQVRRFACTTPPLSLPPSPPPISPLFLLSPSHFPIRTRCRVALKLHVYMHTELTRLRAQLARVLPNRAQGPARR